MSVHWGVAPIVPEAFDWLEEEGFDPSGLESRYPTLEEMLAVLESFDNLPVTKDNYSDNHWDLTVGALGSSQYACVVGEIEDDDQFQFQFFGSSCQEQTMMRILKRLASICGPLILYETIASTPTIVTESIDIDQALDEWESRSREKYLASGLITNQ